MSDELSEKLTCTICNERKETFSEIVYSQGARVCKECKKGTQAADNAAFDSYMDSRIIGGFHVVK